jgi:hypothetical protein
MMTTTEASNRNSDFRGLFELWVGVAKDAPFSPTSSILLYDVNWRAKWYTVSHARPELTISWTAYTLVMIN